MFFLIGITISSFLAVLLLLKRKKSNADRILMIWMAAMAIHQILFYLSYSGHAEEFPHLMGLVFPWPALHGGFLFIYVTTMTREKPLTWLQMAPHFIPFWLLFGLAIPYYLLPAEKKIEIFHNQGAGWEWYITIHQIVIITAGLGYTIWSLIRIHRHRNKIKQWFSNTEKISLRWLEYLSIGLGGIWLLVVFFNDKVIFTGVVILVLFIGFFGINQLPIFYAHPDLVKNKSQAKEDSFDEFVQPEKETETEQTRYAKSGLKPDEAEELHQKLSELMEKEAFYKRSDITLADLAAMLDTHPNYLSQVINEKENMNFYNYINTLRIKGFIDAAADPGKKHYSYLALAFDSGFNSKSTFNKYFKTTTGKSPSEYFSA